MINSFEKYVLPIWVRITLFAVGILLIYFGNVWEDAWKDASIWWRTFPHSTSEMGVAVIIAGIVSWFFDVAYHKLTFGEPVKGIERRMEELGTTVGEFNQVLKASQLYGITCIHRRQTPEEMAFWKQRIVSEIGSAEKFILCMGRSFDSLLPLRKPEGFYKELEKKFASQVPIMFLVANTYDKETGYRNECEVRKGLDSSGARGLFMKSRHTVQQLLKLCNEHQAWKHFSIRLLKQSPPFAMFITEKGALIEPYLPFLDGGEGMYFELRPQLLDAHLNYSSGTEADIYYSYLECFLDVFKLAEPVAPVLQRWVQTHQHQAHSENENAIPIAEKIQKLNLSYDDILSYVKTKKPHPFAHQRKLPL